MIEQGRIMESDVWWLLLLLLLLLFFEIIYLVSLYESNLRVLFWDVSRVNVAYSAHTSLLSLVAVFVISLDFLHLLA